MKSLSIIFTGKDQLEVSRIEVPEPNAGQILVEARRTLVSTGTECTCYQRRFEPGSHWDRWVKYPFYPGYSHAGVVVKVGEGVKSLKPGDRVATRSQHAQYTLTEEETAVKIPDGVTDDDATWFGIACIVQNGVRRAEHGLGDDVVIVGLGMLGQLAIQFVRLMGAREIIVIDTAPRRLEMAGAHGATVLLEKGVADAAGEVSEATGGRLADVVYDITGHPSVLPLALPLVRTLGKLVMLGDPGSPTQQHLTGDLITRGLKIIGAHDGNPPATPSDYNWWTRSHMAELFMTYLKRKQMRVDDLITHRFSPHDAAKAYLTLVEERSTAMGVIFDWEQL